MAEGEGFEPSTDVTTGKRLAGARTRPLCDPSGVYSTDLPQMDEATGDGGDAHFARCGSNSIQTSVSFEGPLMRWFLFSPMLGGHPDGS